MIELKNVSYKTILCDISLSIEKGDYVAIIGPNGGGKSTLLKLMLNLLKKDDGIITLFSTPQEKFKAYYNIGYVAQNTIQIDANFPATVEEIIKLGVAYKTSFLTKMTKEESLYMEYLMEAFDILGIRHQQIGDLSGGQRQRVMITKALLNQPKLLILDEPNAGIDEESQKTFYTLLKELNHSKRLKEDVNKVFHINKVLS
jgi:zinc transport system ATP-binding protein